MSKRNRSRVFAVLALILTAGSLAGCGCGPLGLSWCGGGPGGGPGGGRGGGWGGGPGGPGGGWGGGPGGGPGSGPGGGWR
ncbi:hypothetical protein [Roseomonas elaeocarpi]|uniref:Uncharacterized protein n=1 Tax=Roseomonas elaeocarpi TaxID=907779 RepID=A0ABV6JR77_9PROT